MVIDLQTLRGAVDGTAAAFRCVTDYQPSGGPGDKVFPPTYEGGKYATEDRIDPETGAIRQCVLLDSVQSQANRMELALLESHRAGKVALPLLVTRFDQQELLKKFTVTSLEAPHRVADALFRDSLLDGTIFRRSYKGAILDTADVRNATGLFGLCPTGLVFGLWDSTGPRGGLGAKFQRAVVSEIVGFDAVVGTKTVSRIDPAQIMLGAGPLYERSSAEHDEPGWTLETSTALVEKSKPKPFGKKPENTGKPSAAVHGNIRPDILPMAALPSQERGRPLRCRSRFCAASDSRSTVQPIRTAMSILPLARRLLHWASPRGRWREAMWTCDPAAISSQSRSRSGRCSIDPVKRRESSSSTLIPRSIFSNRQSPWPGTRVCPGRARSS